MLKLPKATPVGSFASLITIQSAKGRTRLWHFETAFSAATVTLWGAWLKKKRVLGLDFFKESNNILNPKSRIYSRDLNTRQLLSCSRCGQAKFHMFCCEVWNTVLLCSLLGFECLVKGSFFLKRLLIGGLVHFFVFFVSTFSKHSCSANNFKQHHVPTHCGCICVVFLCHNTQKTFRECISDIVFGE